MTQAPVVTKVVLLCRTTDTTGDKGQPAKAVSNTVKEAAITKMLIATSILFIVCILPTIMVQV
jgi:hypothetical protein